MGDKMKRLIIVLLFFFKIITPDNLWALQNELELKSETFNDNDGSSSLVLDQLLHWKDKSLKIGLGATQTIIKDSDSQRSFNGGELEGYKTFGSLDFTGKIKLLRWNDTLKTPMNLASSQQFDHFRFEENFEFGTIDSIKGYDAHIDFKSIGGSIDYLPVKNFSVTGGYLIYHISDDNVRRQILLQCVYDLNDSSHFRYRFKDVHNKERVREYFSPEIFDQHALLFGYFKTFFDEIRFKFWTGPILQDDRYEKQFGVLEDIRAVWRINNMWEMNVRLEANQIRSGYRYVYSTMSVMYNF
jgi:hypothetical protein